MDKDGFEMRLKDNLIVLRNVNGFSQEEIAEKIGISRQAYAKWEKGSTVPDIDKCARLAEVYGITVDTLIHFNTHQEGMTVVPAPKGKHIFGTVTINERGQIVIPKAARETMQINSGDRMIVLGEEGEGIALVKAEVFENKMKQVMEQANKILE